MKQRFLAIVGAVSLAGSLLAGCQTVGGVDLNLVAKNSLNIQSYEGTQALKLQLVTGEAREGYPDLTVLKDVSVQLTDVKQQDATHSSAKGELKAGERLIPFSFSSADDQQLLKVDGADTPFIIEPHAKAAEKASGGMMGFDISSLDWGKLLQEHGATLLKYMPKPDSLTVTDAKATINGEALSLKKVHIDLKGGELAALLQGAIKNLLADEEGGDALIKSVVSQVLGDNNSELANSLAVVVVRRMLNEVASDLSILGEGAKYLNDNNTLKLDLYVDGDSQIRRSEFALSLTGLELLDGTVTGLKATGEQDRWNINKAVKADAIDATGAVKLEQSAGAVKFAKGLDAKSPLYKLLIDDLKVTRKNIVLPPIQTGLPGDVARPYIADEVTLVPLRFVSENLDATVEWNDAAKQVTVTDIMSGKTLLFTIGSKVVLVDGKEQLLETEAALTGDYTYVPVRFIAETFGAKVGWDDQTWVVSIIRN